MFDYDEYTKKFDKEFELMVTSPDPEDGHTHLVYINKSGNGTTNLYPDVFDGGDSGHQHIVIGESVIPSLKWCSYGGVSYHRGLQKMSEADKKEALNKDIASGLDEVFSSVKETKRK